MDQIIHTMEESINRCRSNMKMMSLIQRRKASVLSLVSVLVLALTFPSVLTPYLSHVLDYYADYDTKVDDDVNGDEDERMDSQFRRFLLEEFEKDEEELLAIPELLYDSVGHNSSSVSNFEAMVPSANSPSDHSLSGPSSLPPYTLVDAIRASDIYSNTFALLIYDPVEDKFVAFYSRYHAWASSCDKLFLSFKHLAYMLRTLFPDRFQGLGGGKDGIPSSELVIPISSGDFPAMSTKSCLQKRDEFPCDADITAPILHFGSVFRNQEMFPSMIGMPMPESHHLDCFEQWAKHGTVCDRLRPRTADSSGKLIFGPEFGLQYDKLIPQVVWRGTDFSFLSDVYPELRAPDVPPDIQRDFQRSSRTGENGLRPGVAYTRTMRSLRSQFGFLLPRWKGVLYTAEAESSSLRTGEIPWANMKFSSYIREGKKTPTLNSKEYKKWQDIGFPAVGEAMTLDELAKYKYHIDLGGGGGTTW